jgi:four helix bundle protein
MNYKYGFEKLEVWQDARYLVKKIYKLTAKYPSSEKFGLVNQMRRCAVSISSNIAEGTGRTGVKDQAHFYSMAYSSCLELMSQTILSLDLEFIIKEEEADIRGHIQLVSNKINALRKERLSR